MKSVFNSPRAPGPKGLGRAAIYLTALLGLAVLAQDAGAPAPERRIGEFETPEGVVEMEYSVIDGQAVFEGDILLPPPAEPHKGRREGAGLATIGRRWPYGIIPYESNFVFLGSLIDQAMKAWMRVTPIRFIPVSSYSAVNRIRFDISGENQCSSSVGMQGGAQVMRLSYNCPLPTVIHELGHAIGLWHEHTRPDRDFFITLNFACVDSINQPEFNTWASGIMPIGTYDLNSIMHYPTWAFVSNRALTGGGTCNTPSIRTNSGAPIPYSVPSTGDIASVQTLYGAWTNGRRAVSYDGAVRVGNYAYWTPSTGMWTILNKYTNAVRRTQWGQAGDTPVSADYDGDGIADLAVWKPSTGIWSILGSKTNSQLPNRQWGATGDIPVPFDYDGDSKADLAVWRPSNGVWYVWGSKTNSRLPDQQWGQLGDVPVPGDFDGDGRTDYSVWRPSDGTWYIINSSGRGLGSQDGVTSTRQWGEPGDVPVPGDYNQSSASDLAHEVAVFRPSDGDWWVLDMKSGQRWRTKFATGPADVPVP
jgi:hypothetical protein